VEFKPNGSSDFSGFRRPYQRRRRFRETPAERAARFERNYQDAIARKGLRDSSELRFLFKLCPERFWDLPIDPKTLLERVDTTLGMAAFCEKLRSGEVKQQ
jgi:hypothetical protein